MKSKKLISLLCAASLSVSAFAGLGISASAADGVTATFTGVDLTGATSPTIVRATYNNDGVLDKVALVKNVTAADVKEGTVAYDDTATTDTSTSYFLWDMANVKPLAAKATVTEYNLPEGTYAVVIDSEITGGRVTVDKTTAAENETVTITVEASNGYKLVADSVKVTAGSDDVTVTQDTTDETKYTFTMPAASVTVTAEFKEVLAPYDRVPSGDNIVEGSVHDLLDGTETTLDEESNRTVYTLAADKTISFDDKIDHTRTYTVVDYDIHPMEGQQIEVAVTADSGKLTQALVVRDRNGAAWISTRTGGNANDVGGSPAFTKGNQSSLAMGSWYNVTIMIDPSDGIHVTFRNVSEDGRELGDVVAEGTISWRSGASTNLNGVTIAVSGSPVVDNFYLYELASSTVKVKVVEEAAEGEEATPVKDAVLKLNDIKATTATTGEDGKAELVRVLPGTYSLSVDAESEGYVTKTVDDIVVPAADTITVELEKGERDTFNVYAVDPTGEKIVADPVATGSGFIGHEGTTTTSLNKVIKSNDKFYVLADVQTATVDGYSVSIDEVKADASDDVNVTYVEDPSIVYYTEAEALANSVKTTDSKYSGGGYGGTKESTGASLGTYTAGVNYELTAYVVSAPNRQIALREKSVTWSETAGLIAKSEEVVNNAAVEKEYTLDFSVEADTEVWLTGYWNNTKVNQGANLDYIIIRDKAEMPQTYTVTGTVNDGIASVTLAGKTNLKKFNGTIDGTTVTFANVPADTYTIEATSKEGYKDAAITVDGTAATEIAVSANTPALSVTAARVTSPVNVTKPDGVTVTVNGDASSSVAVELGAQVTLVVTVTDETKELDTVEFNGLEGADPTPQTNGNVTTYVFNMPTVARAVGITVTLKDKSAAPTATPEVTNPTPTPEVTNPTPTPEVTEQTDAAIYLQVAKAINWTAVGQLDLDGRSGSSTGGAAFRFILPAAYKNIDADTQEVTSAKITLTVATPAGTDRGVGVVYARPFDKATFDSAVSATTDSNYSEGKYAGLYIPKAAAPTGDAIGTSNSAAGLAAGGKLEIDITDYVKTLAADATEIYIRVDSESEKNKNLAVYDFSGEAANAPKLTVEVGAKATPAPTATPEVTNPTEAPTATPEVTNPTEAPTATPEVTNPTEAPTSTPTTAPTATPTTAPTATPTAVPAPVAAAANEASVEDYAFVNDNGTIKLSGKVSYVAQNTTAAAKGYWIGFIVTADEDNKITDVYFGEKKELTDSDWTKIDESNDSNDTATKVGFYVNLGDTTPKNYAAVKCDDGKTYAWEIDVTGATKVVPTVAAAPLGENRYPTETPGKGYADGYSVSVDDNNVITINATDLKPSAQKGEGAATTYYVGALITPPAGTKIAKYSFGTSKTDASEDPENNGDWMAFYVDVDNAKTFISIELDDGRTFDYTVNIEDVSKAGEISYAPAKLDKSAGDVTLTRSGSTVTASKAIPPHGKGGSDKAEDQGYWMGVTFTVPTGVTQIGYSTESMPDTADKNIADEKEDGDGENEISIFTDITAGTGKLVGSKYTKKLYVKFDTGKTYTITFEAAIAPKTSEGAEVEAMTADDEDIFGNDLDAYGTFEYAANKITGTAKKVTTDGFNTVESGETVGYYLPLCFVLPEGATDATTVSYVTDHEGSVKKTFTGDKLDEGHCLDVLFYLYDDTKTVTFTVDLDGKGLIYEATDYVIDISEIVRHVVVPTVAAAPIVDKSGSEVGDVVTDYGIKSNVDNVITLKGTNLKKHTGGNGEGYWAGITVSVSEGEITRAGAYFTKKDSAEQVAKYDPSGDDTKTSYNSYLDLSKKAEEARIWYVQVVVDDVLYTYQVNATEITLVAQDSAATTAVRTTGEWGKYGYVYADMTTGIQIAEGKVTGTVNWVEPTGKAAGYYLPIRYTIDQAFVATATIDGEKINADTFSPDDWYDIIWNVNDAVDGKLTVTIDLDGNGDVYAPADITLDISDVEKALKGTVTIGGEAKVGETLKATADLKGGAVAKYQWLADGEVIANATGDEYVLTENEKGKAIKVVVTAEGFSGSVTSAPTAEVESNVPDPQMYKFVGTATINSQEGVKVPIFIWK